MRKHLLCLILVGAAGCAEQPESASTASAPASVDVNAVALAKFMCPGIREADAEQQSPRRCNRCRV